MPLRYLRYFSFSHCHGFRSLWSNHAYWRSRSKRKLFYPCEACSLAHNPQLLQKSSRMKFTNLCHQHVLGAGILSYNTNKSLMRNANKKWDLKVLVMHTKHLVICNWMINVIVERLEIIKRLCNGATFSCLMFFLSSLLWRPVHV